MREIFIKIKGFGHHLAHTADFEDYSLSLDRLDKLIDQVAIDNHKASEEKKENSKEIKAKNNQLKEFRKEIDTLRETQKER